MASKRRIVPARQQQYGGDHAQELRGLPDPERSLPVEPGERRKCLDERRRLVATVHWSSHVGPRVATARIVAPPSVEDGEIELVVSMRYRRQALGERDRRDEREDRRYNRGNRKPVDKGAQSRALGHRVLALELPDGALDAIESLVQILRRSGVREPHVLGRAEVVAANQRDVCLVEQKCRERVAIGDLLVAKAAAEQLGHIRKSVKRALRYIGQLESRDSPHALDHQRVALAKRLEHRLERVLRTGQRLDRGGLRDRIGIPAVLALQPA